MTMASGRASIPCTGAAPPGHLEEYDPHCHPESNRGFKHTKQNDFLQFLQSICLHAVTWVIIWWQLGQHRIDGTLSCSPIDFLSAIARISHISCLNDESQT